MVSRRSRQPRFALWLIACALLLKAAVPMLATWAAQMRGVSVAAVCSVYGVSLPAAAHEEHAHAGHHHAVQHDGDADEKSQSGAPHGSDHCALKAGATLAMPAAAGHEMASAARVASVVAVDGQIAFQDPSAAWVSRIAHGPPGST